MLSVGSIGARDGDILEGNGKQVKGTVIKIRGKIPPVEKFTKSLYVEDIRDKLNNYSFFSNMNTDERREWLNRNADDKELYLQDVDDLYIKFNAIGGDFIMKNLSQDVRDRLLDGNPEDEEGYWNIVYVYNLFPRKPGSRAARHTLIFRPGNWNVYPDIKDKISSYEGITFNLEDGSISMRKLGINDNFYIIPIEENLKATNPGVKDIALSNKGIGDKKLDFDYLIKICEKIGLNIVEMLEISKIISWFTPSPHKSLIQKILRTRCNKVEYNDKLYDAKDVLITSFCMLIIHPGSFVSNIQRFVTGLESGLKRLAVSIAEDAYIDDPRMILSLLSGAWLAQNDKRWIPTEEILIKWINTGIRALEFPNSYKYDWNNCGRVIKEWNPWYGSYYMLAKIKSFQSDIDMFCSIAENNGIKSEYIDNINDRIMPIIHCVDHHAFTEIAHYMPYDMIKHISYNYKNDDFGNLFKAIWNEATGINGRKDNKFNFLSGNEIFTYIQSAQRMVWISRMYKPEYMKTIDTDYILKYKLSDGWLSSFVGYKEINIGTSTAIVVMHADDPYRYIAVKKPSRDKNIDPELTQEEKEKAINIFRNSLIEGIFLDNIPKTLELFKDSKLYLEDDEYYLEKNGIKKLWSDSCNLEIIYKSHLEINPDNILYHTLLYTGDGVMINADEKFLRFIETVPQSIMNRSLLYLDFDSSIELYHISRNGKGVDYSVSIDDAGVNYLFAMISLLYPAALEKNVLSYKVKSGPLMWYVISMIKSRIVRKYQYKWETPEPERRLLWDHQTEAIDNLIRMRDENKRVKLIWIPPGLGKTAIVVNYIADNISNNKMPKYCVYTLPPSALATIQREFTLRNIPYIHLDMRTTAKTPKELIPGVINIIYHDHLRLSEHIKEYASDMLFIVDEFHKTLNKTIRTSITLELTHLASDVIALTGTLIKDQHIEPVIQWIKQGVDFEVNTKNYWVGLSSIISRKVQTKIPVERIIREAVFTDNERNEYYSVVPENLGGTAKNIDFRKAVNISYEAITRELINLALFHINAGLGVFLVSRNISHQDEIASILRKNGIDDIFLIKTGNSISLTPTDPPPGVYVPKIVITTPQHSEGYNLTRFNIMLTGVYFTNQATRDQLEARVNRIDSISNIIRIVVVHAGIISYIHENYEKARSLSAAIKGFAKDINLDPKNLEI